MVYWLTGEGRHLGDLTSGFADWHFLCGMPPLWQKELPLVWEVEQYWIDIVRLTSCRFSNQTPVVGVDCPFPELPRMTGTSPVWGYSQATCLLPWCWSSCLYMITNCWGEDSDFCLCYCSKQEFRLPGPLGAIRWHPRMVSTWELYSSSLGLKHLRGQQWGNLEGGGREEWP